MLTHRLSRGKKFPSPSGASILIPNSFLWVAQYSTRFPSPSGASILIRYIGQRYSILRWIVSISFRSINSYSAPWSINRKEMRWVSISFRSINSYSITWEFYHYLHLVSISFRSINSYSVRLGYESFKFERFPSPSGASILIHICFLMIMKSKNSFHLLPEHQFLFTSTMV